MSEWIKVGKWQDILDGKKQIIIYTNTIDMIWHVGIWEYPYPNLDEKEVEDDKG